jgi:peptide deformylase
VPARPVLRYPHPALKQPCSTVQAGERAVDVARDLVETMRSFPRCVGIAAPQIGELVRIVVVDASEHPKTTVTHGLQQLANPRIVWAEGDDLGREGCLSIPDLTANVRRATRVRVEAQTPEGGDVVVETEGFEARVLQHEIDHLDGILFLDRIASREDLFARRRSG